MNTFRHKVNDSSQLRPRQEKTWIAEWKMGLGEETTKETKNRRKKSKSFFNQRIALSEFNAKKGFE